MENKKFLHYIHFFRGLAILFIVGLHACISLNWGASVLSKKIILVLFNNGTVLFVFISGYLFYHLSKDRFDYLDYLKKKFLFVILPYLIVSVPALIDKFFIDKMGDHWWMDHGFGQKSLLAKLIILLVTGRHMGVFWFIPMISVLYIFSPLILRFAKSKSFLFIAPLIIIYGMFSFKFGYYANIGLSLIYFVPVYLFGIWVYRIHDVIFEHAKVIIIGGATVYLSMSLLEILEWIPFDDLIRIRDGYVTYEGFKLNYNKLKMEILCVFALVLFYKMSDWKMPMLKLLGDYSFGIFFVHLYIIEILRLLDRGGIAKISPLNLIIFIPYYLYIAITTVLIVRFVKYILKDNSRYFIGS